MVKTHGKKLAHTEVCWSFLQDGLMSEYIGLYAHLVILSCWYPCRSLGAVYELHAVLAYVINEGTCFLNLGTKLEKLRPLVSQSEKDFQDVEDWRHFNLFKDC